MIFVSSSCVEATTIKDAVLILVSEGFTNIELSGGTDYYNGYENDLMELQDRFSLNYLVHNYFPPPKEPFMLNLASLNDDIYCSSIEHCRNAISLSKKIGSPKYGVHAGFLIDFKPHDAGKKIRFTSLNDREEALNRFCAAWEKLMELAAGEVILYIENNVISQSNKKTFGEQNPFLITDFEGYLELKNRIDFQILLDLAHLKVSCHSSSKPFFSQFNDLVALTDYCHISGNDCHHDQNLTIVSDEQILSCLKEYEWKFQTITLEIYNDIQGLKDSFIHVKKCLNKISLYE